MYAHITQDNGNISKQILHTQSHLGIVSEPSDMKQNLVDKTCELLK